MNADQAELFQKLLEEACDHFTDSGGKIITLSFMRSDGAMCPLTCLLGRRNTVDMLQELAHMLDTTISWDELWTFIHTFDSAAIKEHQKQYVSMVLIAKALREKYIEVPA